MSSTVDLVDQSTENISSKKDSSWDTLIAKLKYVKEVITVEPLVTSYLVAAVICLPALLTLELEKTCRANLRQNKTVCKAIRESEYDNYTEVNLEITLLLNGIHSWQAPLQYIVPLILVLFIGSFSDRRQIRKPFMILPLIGELLAVVGCILSVIFMEEWPVEVQGFLQAVVPSLFGGPTMLIMAVFAYVADSSSIEMRTVRIAVVQAVLNVAIPIGQFLSGFLFIHLDYIGVLLVAGGLYLFGIFYGLFFIKEVKQPKTDGKKKNLLKDICDPTNLLDTIKLIFVRKKNKDISLFHGILALFFVVTGVTNVNLTTMFLYLNNVFHWTGPDFSLYATTNTVIHLIGVVLFVPLFTKVFHFTDLTILMITFLDRIAATIVTGSARTTLFLYIGSLVSIISNITIIALRSMATKSVSEEDLGKAQSLFGICEALGISVMTPLINMVFTATLHDNPSAFIYAETAIYIFCFFSAINFYLKENKLITLNNSEELPGTKTRIDEVQVTHM